VCRLAAYIGEPLRLGRFITDPPHGLVEQAHSPRETLSATVNADGFGVGWHDGDGRPAVYRTPLPIWADPNLEPLGRSLTRPLWLANVRSATDPLSGGYGNTQPFHDERLLFLHNGYVRHFGTELRARVRRWLAGDIEEGIRGTTDSEYIFAILRQLAGEVPGAPLVTPVRTAMDYVDQWLGDSHALLNIVVADTHRVVGIRHAIAADCPSLYYHGGHPGLGGQLIASEPLDDDPDWCPIAPHHMVILEPGHEAEHVAI